MKNKKTISVKCGDWHLGWGLGGHDKIGKLSFDIEKNSYHWAGFSQGRHGQKWNKGAKCIFKTDINNNINVDTFEREGSVPELSELQNGVNEIKLKLKHYESTRNYTE